ncbi:MAG: alanine racemase, partial [Bacteroidales bacterium]|nr:alanine racemase [Bacteroidales bacterium]
LQEKTHQTVLEVNLDHMLSNLNFFKSKLKKETKMMVMVKAFSYGSGSFEIANLVQYFRADYLSVAYADEGVELRKSGISLPIMVMSPDINNIDTLLKYDLEPEIYNFRILSVLEASIKKTIQPKNKPVRIHLKLDTGMNRLGFDEQNIEKLVKRINDNPLLKIQSVFSHLANSDDTTFDKYTNDQFDLFNSMCQKIQDLTTQTFIKHMLNSAGISRFPEQQMDMVRLGLGLYGLSPIANEQKHLLNVNLLKTTITQIKQIKQGDSVGYSRAFVAKNDMKIATIPIGYADGIHRFLGNGKYEMTINGKKASTLGNICMDMCMLDISHIDCQEGDEVIVFQNQDEINEMAKTGSTIAYEIISGISQRVKRVYFKE